MLNYYLNARKKRSQVPDLISCRNLLIKVVLIMTTLVAVPVVQADDATVLPADVSRGYVDLYHYQPTTQRYSADGDREDLAFPFTNAALDSGVLPNLSPLDQVLGNTATLGDVAVDYEYDIDVIDFGYAYGLTDRLSIGIHIPYYWITNNVDTDFDNTGANVGLIPGTGACCIPVSAGGVPLTENDVQNLINTEFGISDIDTWDREGIGDTELGAKYLVYREQESAFAVTGGLRIPTGYEDDADKLNDVAWSYGNYALLLRLHYDYLLSNLWNDSASSLDQIKPVPGDMILNVTLRYDLMLPDKKTMRVGNTPDQVFTNDRERVDRDLGDLYNLEISAKYQATSAFAYAFVYTYSWKSKDDISGDLGYNYSSLEANTDSSHQIYVVSASYSTLAAYRNQQSRVPMNFYIDYRDRFKGEGPRSGQANPVLDTSWLSVGLEVLF